MFDYKLLEALAVTVEAGGFEKASNMLGLSQSAVSQRIKLLEQRQGTILLTRTNPPIPTDTGQILLTHYKQVKHLEEELIQPGEEDFAKQITFSIGINADSLATWFLPCISSFLLKNNVLLDLHVDDQDQTFGLLKRGMVWGCVSTRESSAHGCTMFTLGNMQYSLCCTPAFSQKWFSKGLTINAVKQAPIIRFNRNDFLNDIFFTRLFGNNSPNRSEFFVPSSEKFLEFILAGITCGIVPQLQCRQHISDGHLVNCVPSENLSVPLYWHCWDIKTTLMHSFTKCLLTNRNHIF